MAAKALEEKRATRTRKAAKAPMPAAEPEAPATAAADGEGRSVRPHTARVRRAMLDAAAELFAARGFAGTNLRDLADALGMSRPGLYYHFPSKEKLLEALIEEVTVSAERQLNEMVTKVDRDPEDALRHVMRVTTQWVLHNHVLFRMLDRSEEDMPEDIRASHNVSKKAILEHFTRIIVKGVEIGKFRPVDPHVAALTLVGMRNWVAWWFNPDGRISRTEIADMVAEMGVRSLLRPDAHRSRSDRISDVLTILKEDVAHLSQLIAD